MPSIPVDGIYAAAVKIWSSGERTVAPFTASGANFLLVSVRLPIAGMDQVFSYGRIVDNAVLVLPERQLAVILVSVFLTVFLVLFLLFNVKQKPVTVYANGREFLPGDVNNINNVEEIPHQHGVSVSADSEISLPAAGDIQPASDGAADLEELEIFDEPEALIALPVEDVSNDRKNGLSHTSPVAGKESADGAAELEYIFSGNSNDYGKDQNITLIKPFSFPYKNPEPLSEAAEPGPLNGTIFEKDGIPYISDDTALRNSNSVPGQKLNSDFAKLVESVTGNKK
jgi:hypothetical protein